MTKEKLTRILRETIDIHVHIGPEIIPRKFTVASLRNTERGKLKGCVLKNHFYPTASLIPREQQSGLQLYGGIVLNNFVGGLNPDALYASSYVTPQPLFVWMPTLHTRQFLANCPHEIPREWIGNRNFRSRPSRGIKPVKIVEGKKLSPEVFPVLRAIKDVKGVLCTGHISAAESVLLVTAARKVGIRNIVITHPIYQKINMSVETQNELATMGCLIEHCYSMLSIDKIPIEKIAEQIADVGSKNVILSSDVGQLFSPSPSQALALFTKRLLKAGLSCEELKNMLIRNPQRLLGY